MLPLVAIIGFIIVSLVYAVRAKLYLWVAFLKIPSPPGKLLSGHYSEFARPNFHQHLADWTYKYGLVYR